MNQGLFTVIENSPIGADIYSLCLLGDCANITAPGQFASVKIDGRFLRRPFSVCDWNGDTLRIVYKVVGDGTAALSSVPAAATLDVMTGLGNGYDTSVSGENPLLIGGGMGATPLLCLCKRLVSEGKKPTVLLGFASESEAILLNDFAALGVDVRVATADGSLGHKGFVTELMGDIDYSYFYSCGPEAMFKSIDEIAKTEGQFSFEARMGCGFGACMGCTCKTHKGSKRICKDGPVLERSEVIW